MAPIYGSEVNQHHCNSGKLTLKRECSQAEKDTLLTNNAGFPDTRREW